MSEIEHYSMMYLVNIIIPSLSELCLLNFQDEIRLTVYWPKWGKIKLLA